MPKRTPTVHGTSTPHEEAASPARAPLADRLRPDRWEEFVNVEQFDKHLLNQLRAGRGTPPSMVLWGPPGSGKTTLARIVGRTFDCRFVQFSAVLGGVKEVRAIVDEARSEEKKTILFVDEIHRFNKSQQDAFLPHIEDGTIVLIGATTENPSFYLTNALRSRLRVVVLKPIAAAALRALAERGAREIGLEADDEALDLMVNAAQGDARRLLNTLEAFKGAHGAERASAERVKGYLRDSGQFLYDKTGDFHYQLISAFIKSLRGSNADAALYYGFRILESGEDPRFLIRRMMIFASEDIGNADPRGLQVAVATAQAYDQLGLPEGRIPIAQCITYLAGAPKSNRSYKAMHMALAAIREHPDLPVPLHLSNAPTKLMESLGYSEGYQYPHDFNEGFAPGVEYMPKGLEGARWYEPSERGYEKTMRERAEYLKNLVKQS